MKKKKIKSSPFQEISTIFSLSCVLTRQMVKTSFHCAVPLHTNPCQWNSALNVHTQAVGCHFGWLMSRAPWQTKIFLKLSVQLLTQEISQSCVPPVPGLHFPSVQEGFAQKCLHWARVRGNFGADGIGVVCALVSGRGNCRSNQPWNVAKPSLIPRVDWKRHNHNGSF